MCKPLIDSTVIFSILLVALSKYHTLRKVAGKLCHSPQVVSELKTPGKKKYTYLPKILMIDAKENEKTVMAEKWMDIGYCPRRKPLKPPSQFPTIVPLQCCSEQKRLFRFTLQCISTDQFKHCWHLNSSVSLAAGSAVFKHIVLDTSILDWLFSHFTDQYSDHILLHICNTCPYKVF